MKVIETAKSVEVDGVIFTEEALGTLVHLARQQAKISLFMIGEKIVFTKAEPPVAGGQPSWESGAAPGHRMNTHVCSPDCFHNNNKNPESEYKMRHGDERK